MLLLSFGQCLQVALYRRWHSSLHFNTKQQSFHLSHRRQRRITKCTSLQHHLCKTHTTAFSFCSFSFSILYVNSFLKEGDSYVNSSSILYKSLVLKESLILGKGVYCFCNSGVICVISEVMGFINIIIIIIVFGSVLLYISLYEGSLGISASIRVLPKGIINIEQAANSKLQNYLILSELRKTAQGLPSFPIVTV